MRPAPPASVAIRPVGDGDLPAICALINADQLPGQPRCDPPMLTAALAGSAPVDQWWWDQLATHEAVAAVDPTGEVVAAAAAGTAADTSRMLLWLHAGEHRPVIDALLDRLLPAPSAQPTYAFWFATPLTAGLEGLPRHARPVTHQALLDHGLLGHDEWLYMRAPEPCPPADDALAVRHERTDDGDRLELVAGDDVAGHAVVSVPHPGIGVVWWLEIAADHRRHGLGRQLLRAARHHLHRAGANQTILYVDHADHDRQAAIALYRAEGFAVIDHLYAYRTPHAPDIPSFAS